MRKLITRSSIVLLVSMITSCNTMPIPAWVENKSEHYTTTDYLLGHGIGDNQEIAEENASKKITLQFKDVASIDELDSQTKIIFNQIEFEQPWVDTDASETHVLAYISRNKAASFIYSKMLALDELTYRFFELAKKTTDLLEQTSYIDSAISAQTNRIGLKPILKIITSENDIPSEYNIKRLSKIRDQLQARINLTVEIKNAKDTPSGFDIDSVIKNSLDAAGFVRNDKKTSKNRLIVELKVTDSPKSQSSDGLFMQGVLTTTLQHTGDESDRGQYQWTFNATAKDQNSLIQKSQEILSKQLNAKLKHVLMDMMIIEYISDENIPSQDYVDIDMPEFNSNEETPPETNKENQAQAKETTSESQPTTESDPAKTEAAAIVAEPVKDAALKKTTADTETQKSDSKQVEPSTIDVEDPVSTLPPLSN
ncbi:MAG: hypothetical protein ACC653_08615 [Gammaproteobacteria bacterium]